jgi:aminoglycoside phosphotransferase (APT) family kinase protein
MESLTKRSIELAEIEAAVKRCFGDVRITEIEELPDGMFNAVHRVRLEPGNRTVVMKTSPPAHVPLLTYERDILRTETAFYERAFSAGLPVPQVLGRDFTRTHLDGDVLFVSFVEGQGWHRMHDALSQDDKRRLRRDLGRLLRRLHAIRGTHFGYFQPGAARADTWCAAFVGMVNDVLSDAMRFGVKLPVDPLEVGAALDRHSSLLDDVTTPALVHFDLWEGNILLADRAGWPTIAGLIDGERAMWADPVAELAAAALFGDVAEDACLLAGYNAELEPTEQPLMITPRTEVRLAMYKAYLDLIILVEATPRGYDAVSHAHITELATADLRRCLDLLTKPLS